ncbi:hypothetical protein Tco_0381352 [Tanacetum coccineum]
MLQARENLMEVIQAFLKKYDQMPPEEKCIALLRAEEKFLKVKQAFEEEKNQPEVTQELLLQLTHDLQLLNEILLKQAEEKGINKQTSFLIEKPKDYLIMEDEDINTIPKKESDEENESSVENLLHIPSESEVTFDNESEYDLLIFYDFSSLYNSEDDYVIFSRPLFDSYGDTTSSEYSSDNESILEEDVFSNLPFEFDEESISSDVNPIYDEVLEDIDCTNSLIDSFPSGNDDISFDFGADPREIKSLLNQDALITSPMIDPLLEEFASELALINLIPSGIDEVDFDHEEDIHLIEKLSYDNLSPRQRRQKLIESIVFMVKVPYPSTKRGVSDLMMLGLIPSIESPPGLGFRLVASCFLLSASVTERLSIALFKEAYSQYNMIVQDTLTKVPSPAVRLVQRVLYVRWYRKVRAVALLAGRWFAVYRDYLRWRAVK